MIWIGIIIGLFVGTFLGLCFGGLLAAASRGDNLLAVAVSLEEKSRPSSLAS
jgi:hypothetical protein